MMTRKPRSTSRSGPGSAGASPPGRRQRDGIVQQKLWLMYPPRLIKQPLIWQLGRKFHVVTNIRQASVTDQIGIVCLELDGKRSDVKASIQWLEKLGVNVDPVEISVVES